MDPQPLHEIHELAVAAALGFLVGLERERAKAIPGKTRVAGVRTLPLISLWGVLAARFAETYTPWILVLSLAGLLAFVGIAYAWELRQKGTSPGLTTSVVVVITFLAGVLVHAGETFAAVVLAVAMTALLAFKPQIHEFAHGLTQEHLLKILEFVVLMAIVLPLLPSKAVDPLGAIVPREIGLMVTLIAGIGLAGFLLFRFLGARRGLLFAGAMGGLVSSTALVLSFSRQSKESSGAARDFGIAMGLACTIMYARMFVAGVAANPAFFSLLLVPTGVMFAASFFAFKLVQRTNAPAPPPGDPGVRNPTELSMALKFGVFYSAIKWGASFATERFGGKILYLFAALAGTTDVDAVTLSFSRMAGGVIDARLAAEGIALAAVVNTLVKLGMVVFLAHPDARRIAARVLLPGAVAGIVSFVGMIAWG
ncbi:MAG: DUF4010 domain-containing protein [Bdellovibrionota bacterium]